MGTKSRASNTIKLVVQQFLVLLLPLSTGFNQFRVSAEGGSIVLMHFMDILKPASNYKDSNTSSSQPSSPKKPETEEYSYSSYYESPANYQLL